MRTDCTVVRFGKESTKKAEKNEQEVREGQLHSAAVVAAAPDRRARWPVGWGS